jgi:hypothetical protein
VARRLPPEPSRRLTFMSAIQFSKPDYVDVRPGTMSQVHKALHSGRMVAVDHGPHDVATRLREISDELHLHYDPYEAVWIVMQARHMPDGSVKEHLVTTALECDGRLVERVRQITDSSYNLADELDAAEAKADRAHEQRQSEAFGDASEKLAFALQQDLGRHEIGRTAKSRAYVPRAFKPR